MFADTFHTSFPDIRWPVIPNTFGASLLAMQYQLEMSQWLPAEEIRTRQLRQLQPLFAHACRHVPWYRRRLEAAGLAGRASISWEDWRKIPFLRRAEIQQLGNELRSENYPQAHGKLHSLETSGSSGMPVTVCVTDVCQFFWQAITLRDHLWHRRDLLKKLAVIRVNEKVWSEYPHGLRLSGWSGVFEDISRTGPCVIIDVRASIREQAAMLEREQPDYLLAYPSTVAGLARHFAERGGYSGRLAGISTMSETLTAEQRQHCREVFGVSPKDMYSSNEAGYMALQCPEHDQYHVQSESVLLEILNERDEPCASGEIGRIVVTRLHNFAMPIIRYDLQDYAEVGEPCPCGRGLPVLKRILGRVRNLLVLPNGEKIWPTFGSKEYFWKNLPVKQFQLVQKSLESIEARLVTSRPLSKDEEREFTAVLRKRFLYPFQINFVYYDEILRNAGGKYEDFRSEVAASL